MTCVVFCAGFVGCGADTGGRLGVTGTVKLKGQPLDRGTIEFHSQPPAQTVVSGSTIQNGAFSVPAEQGLVPGRYIVRISASAAGPAAEEAAPGEAPPPRAERIPPEFNVDSQLTFEVKSGQQNTLDVDIP